MAQKAFDINFYWPENCTQSGIIAHALGAGSLVAGRDLEGSGEMLGEAGAITGKSLRPTIIGILNLMFNPEFGQEMEHRALKYGEQFSWPNQARAHYDLAEMIMPISYETPPTYTYDKVFSIKDRESIPVGGRSS